MAGQAKQTRRRWDADYAKEVLDTFNEGGYPLVVKRLKVKEGYARTIVRRAQSNGHGRALSATVKERNTSTAITRAIGAYLDEYRMEATSGRRANPGVVHLGQFPQFPSSTTDPDVVDAVANYYDSDVIPNASTAVKELKARQRAMDLRAAAERLRALDEEDDDDSTEAAFIAHAAEWAEANGVTYAAFREMGIPASVLREAGLRP